MDYSELIAKGRVHRKLRIIEDFEGFDEDRIFQFANGEVWKQAEYKYWYSYSFRPELIIYTLNNNYYLVKENNEKFVKVQKMN